MLLGRAILSIAAIVEGIIVELIALLVRLTRRRCSMHLRLGPVSWVHLVVVVIAV